MSCNGLSIDNVSFCYHTEHSEVPTLSDFQLKANAGEFVTILGPNGCGKTTLLNIIGGLEKLQGGSIIFEGKELKSTDVGYVFQDYRRILMPWKTVLENIGFLMRVKGVETSKAKDRVLCLCTQLGLSLPLEKYPHELSGGQQQLAAIVAALVVEPKVLLLDEPFSAIDYQTTLFIREKLIEVWEKYDLTCLCVSHDIDEALLLGSQIVVLSSKPAQVRKVFRNSCGYPRRDFSSSAFSELRLEVFNFVEGSFSI